MTQETLLEVKDLKMHFPIRGGILQRQIATVFAVDGVDFDIRKGETLGLVGESGCGKSTLGRCLLQLYKPTSGVINFNGEDLMQVSADRLRELRRDIQMIFQDPAESLNSRHTVEEILMEPFIIQGVGDESSRKKEVGELLDRVGLASQARYKYPHEFSGGQKQRIGIARAIALKPKLIICDEPVSALDVSIQSQIINLLLELQKELELTYLFIAHDLSVVRHVSDRIAVMYLGRIIEEAHADEIYHNPQHPYTKALMEAIPVPDPDRRITHKVLTGDVPSPIAPPSGCYFHGRCPQVMPECKVTYPALMNKNDRRVSCHLLKSSL